jgi:hypothetical protein
MVNRPWVNIQSKSTMFTPNQKFTANYMKRPLAISVTFAISSGALQTLEGVVQYAAGDALMTGALGEHWPIRRHTFESSYEPCDSQSMGVDGNYRKRAIPVFAQQLKERCVVKLDEKRGVLNGKPGDWILRDATGRTWVVADDIFRISYSALDASEA